MKRILNFLLACLLILPVLPQMTVSAQEALDISETEALYSEFDYSDPNWISDEDFFGVWNSEKLAWEEGKEPYFDYEKYDALAEVEKAAKQGRYDEARELVTKYYKEKFQNQPRTIKTAKDQDTILRAKLQAFNAFYLGGATLLDVIEFTSAPREIMADVTVIAQAVAADSLKTRTFEICAIEKDGYTARIDSRESENQPYVKAEVNGVEKHFPVIRDTYLRGGSYDSVNYGTEPILYVAENPDYTNAGKPPIYTVLPDAPEDPDYSETKRARLTVDFGDAIGGTDHDGLVNGDIITSAKLCMNGSTDKTDGTKKAIVFMNTGGDSEEESGAASKWTWKRANRVYASFSGEAGPIVNKGNFDQTQLHPFENYTALSQVYRYTGDEIYAYHAFRLYNNYIRAYGHRGQSHYMLDLGTRAADLPMILAQLSTSVHFNADNFVPMLKYAWTMGQGLVYGWDSQAQSGNWGLYETAGLAALAINFKEFDIVDDEMIEGGSFGAGNSGGWNKLIKHRYDVLAENILHEDGSFKETLGYAKESLTQYLNYVTFSEEAGEPYEFGEKVMEIFTKLGRYMMVATGPDFVDFQLGDSYGYKTSFRQRIKELADLTNDPLLTWAGTNGKYGTQPDFTSVLYPFRRQALLKTGWSMEDIYIDFSSDQTVSTHNHPDDLNIVMFANGQYLLTDQKQFSYTVNEPERVWVYSTQAHNTLAVPNVTHKANISAIYSGPQQAINGEYIYYNREQEASPGTIHRNENNSGYDFVEMSHPNYENYPYEETITDGQGNVTETLRRKANINCKRGLLLLKKGKYVIVTDYVTALDDSDYTIWQNWHMLPEANISMDEESGIARSNFTGANIQVIPVFSKSQMTAKLEDGYYSPENYKLEEAKYAVYEKTGAGNKVFNTVLLPTKSGAQIEASADNISLNVDETVANAFCLTITDTALNQTTEAVYYKLNDDDYQSQRSFGAYSTDGRLAFVEKTQDNYSQFIVQDGENLINNITKKQLVFSKEPLEELSVTFDSSALRLDTTKDVDLTKLTIRAEQGITNVLLNGKPIPYSQANNYVYFGLEPILADEEQTQDNTGNGGGSVNTGNHGNHSANTGGAASGGAVSGGSGGGAVTPPVTVEPSDAFAEELRGHWGENEIKKLINSGIIKGDDSGKLHLKNTVTRAELLTMLVRALNLEEQPYNGEFSDVDRGDWYAKTLAAAKNANLIDGSGGKAMPNESVTREQMAKFLVAAYTRIGAEKTAGAGTAFTDSGDISDWAKAFVDKAAALGILNGMGDGTFAPKNAVLREQAFAAIGRLIGLQ